MNIAVRYFTKSGNTEKLANAIAGTLGIEAKDVTHSLAEKTDILFLGSSVYAGGVDKSIKEFLEKNATNIGMLVNFSTAALVKSTYKQVKKIANQYNIPIHEEQFYCKGAFAFMHRKRPNENDIENVKLFAKNIVKIDEEN